MKIEQRNGIVIDTDKIADVDAMILEKSEDLYQLCSKYKRQMFLVVNGKAISNGKVDCFFTHLTRDADLLTVEEDWDLLDILMGSVSNCAQEATGGEYSVQKVEL